MRGSGRWLPGWCDSPEAYLNVKRTISPDNRGFRFSHSFFQMVAMKNPPNRVYWTVISSVLVPGEALFKDLDVLHGLLKSRRNVRHHTGPRRTRQFQTTTAPKAASIHIPAKLARSPNSQTRNHCQHRRHNRSRRQRLQFGTSLRTCSRSPEQHRPERQVEELQAGVEPSFAVFP